MLPSLKKPAVSYERAYVGVQGNIAVGPNEELIWYDFGMMSQLQVTTKERLLGKACSAPTLPAALYLVTASGLHALHGTCCRAVLWRCPEGCWSGYRGPTSPGHHCGPGGHPQPEASHHLLPDQHSAAGEVSELCVGPMQSCQLLQGAVASTACTHSSSREPMPGSEQRDTSSQTCLADPGAGDHWSHWGGHLCSCS